ncbi:MAG: lactate racemase domain-containing protein [Microthrixaceae bacterium]
MTAQIGGAHGVLDDEQVADFVEAQLAALDLDGRSLCLVIPDATRQCPLPLLLGAILRAVERRVRSCRAVVALGTHAPLSDAELRRLVGNGRLDVVNHEWWDDDTYVELGELSAADVARWSGGRLRETVPIRVNRHVVEADVTLIVSPVLPHEVIGFSGGHKYLFPGLSGPELIDVTHWLGALITSSVIIGTRGITPVRAMVEAAADKVPGERHALCLVVAQGSGAVEHLAFGETRAAWSSAADVAARTHVRYLDAPVRRVVSLVSERYDDLWTGAKGFYKVEPVVADGGEVILHAPHIDRIARTHPGIERIGYHCRDYFLARWDEVQHLPRGELAHSTHLFGAGTYDPVEGERGRVRVTLATGIAEATTRAVNLGYVDPAGLDLDELEADPDTLVVHDAGEVLYRLR